MIYIFPSLQFFSFYFTVMRGTHKQTARTRKRAFNQPKEESTQQIICTPNLKYDFLSKEPDRQLLYLLRGSQIKLILENMYRFFQSLSGQSRGEKQKEEYKKIMLLLGSPGTGKTASIKYILDELENKKECQHVKRVQILYLNGNSIKKCEQITKQIIKIINKDERGTLKSPYREYSVNQKAQFIINIVYIEEIDEIFKANGEVALGSLIDMFADAYQISNKIQDTTSKKDKKTHKQQINKYLLIGASNTINLQKQIDKKVPQTKTLNVIFTPYNHEGLSKILADRIEKIKQKMDIHLKMEDKLIRYIITKLSENKNDDTRCIIQLVKQLLLFAERQLHVVESLEKGQKAILQVTLDMLHSITKIKNMLINSRVELVKKLNLKQQLILVILYLYIKQKQALEMPYMEIVQQYKRMQKVMGITSYEDVTVAINQLQTYNCIKIRSSAKNKANFSRQKNQSKLSVVLNMSLNDISSALSGNPTLSTYFQ